MRKFLSIQNYNQDFYQYMKQDINISFDWFGRSWATNAALTHKQTYYCIFFNKLQDTDVGSQSNPYTKKM